MFKLIRNYVVPAPTYKIADYIVKSLEAFRKYMIEGNQEIQLPVLDPVPMESFNYSLINTAIGFKMEMSLEVCLEVMHVIVTNLTKIVKC